MVTASIKASNGLVHLISDVLLSDTMLNETTVRTYLTYFADLGADKVSPLTFTPTTVRIHTMRYC